MVSARAPPRTPASPAPKQTPSRRRATGLPPRPSPAPRTDCATARRPRARCRRRRRTHVVRAAEIFSRSSQRSTSRSKDTRPRSRTGTSRSRSTRRQARRPRDLRCRRSPSLRAGPEPVADFAQSPLPRRCSPPHSRTESPGAHPALPRSVAGTVIPAATRPSSWHLPRGSIAPRSALPQTPGSDWDSFRAALHARMQVPAQGESQHTSSTH